MSHQCHLLRDTICLAYKTIFGFLEIAEFGEAELLALLGDDIFPLILKEIGKEIYGGGGGGQEENLSFKFSIEDDLAKRASLLRECLLDLLAIRLINNNCSNNANLLLLEEKEDSGQLFLKPNSFLYKDYPTLLKGSSAAENLLSLVETLDKEYSLREKVLFLRFKATVEAFVLNPNQNLINIDLINIIATALLLDRAKKQLSFAQHFFTLWDFFKLTPRDILEERKAAVIPSPLKSIRIGSVPDRGGVPEGFAKAQVQSDVNRANESLTQKSSNSSSAAVSTPPSRRPFIAQPLVPSNSPKSNVWRKPKVMASPTIGYCKRIKEEVLKNGGAYRGGIYGSYEGSGRQRLGVVVI